ncbi:hypothetical protein AVEN_215275-1 [Araneus ventricosus]|uniref:Uncharacterized protein n=1 Tax=Araneus ventricosus TaxID=182803 RepID=A0A4Y2J6C2_ARAVE|nr:hypothetical protein AVEN_215275-1 [Araneus ventricosus]
MLILYFPLLQRNSNPFSLFNPIVTFACFCFIVTRFHRRAALKAGLECVKSLGAKCPSAGVVRKFLDIVPDQETFSSSNCGYKLRGPFQMSPRADSKPDVNVTLVHPQKKSDTVVA